MTTVSGKATSSVVSDNGIAVSISTRRDIDGRAIENIVTVQRCGDVDL